MATAPTTGSTPGLFRTWLLDHEKLLITAIIALVVIFGYFKITSIIADHDAAALKAAQVVAQQQADLNAALAKQATLNAAQIADDKAQLQVLTDRLTAQNAQLVNANTALAAALTKQQKTDATLPVPDLVNRWAQLTPGSNFAGAIGSGNNVTVTPANAVATVQQLEKVPVLTQQLANETTEKTNDDQLINQQNKSIFDLNNQVGTLNNSVVGLNKTIKDNDSVCQLQIKTINDNARKSKLKWFGAGFVLGFVAREFVGKGF